MKKSFIVLSLALLLACAMSIGVFADFDRTREYKDGQFEDVPADAWYAKTVADCYELGLINGSSATTYNPQGFFTLAEASTIAARMHEIYNGGDGVIPTASGEWYQGAVNYCIANGIIEKGEYANFKKNATRAEMAKIMYNALPKSEWKAINSVSSLPDVDKNTKNGEIIFELYKAGVFTGSDAYGKFQPQAAITRAEVSALVARMADGSQRKTLSLRPLSEIAGISLPGRIYEAYDGYFVFQDEETYKYGIMDVYGNVIHPAKYEKISFEAMQDGYIIFVGDDYTYVTDASGKTIIPEISTYNLYNYSYKGNGFFEIAGYYYHNSNLIGRNLEMVLGDNEFFVLRDEDNYDLFKVVDINGNTVVPWGEYEDIHYGRNSIAVSLRKYYSGYYYECSNVTIYDTKGNVVFKFADDMRMAGASGDLYNTVAQTGKYGLATSDGILVDCLYDNVYINSADGFEFAMCHYGNQFAVYTEAGILFDFDSGYTSASALGDKLLMSNENALHVYDTTKNLVLDLGKIYKDLGAENLYSNVSCVGNLYVMSSDATYVYNKNTKEAYIEEQGYDAFVSGSEKLLYNGKKVVDAFEASHPEIFGTDTVYLDTNGKYGYVSRYHHDISPAIYETPEDAVRYGRYYYDDEAEALKPIKEKTIGYCVLTDENTNKPYIAYGSVPTGYIPVIQYYQKPFYYDSIEHTGFGNYFVCTFGNNHYLVCAG